MPLLRRLITGGVITNVSRTPFVVRVYTDALWVGFCGGSLIGARKVLTAAHCVNGVEGRRTYVGVYQNDILANATPSDPLSDVIFVVDVFVHPRYDPRDITRGNDVAVLTLERAPSRFGTANGPKSIPLGNASFWPRLAYDQPSDAAYVVGYGSYTYGGPQSMYLRIAHVHLYSHAECISYLGHSLSESNLCAGLPDKGSCSGDSGGPLVIAYNGAFVQVGIVSWGVRDCGSVPGVYSLTSAAHDVLSTRGAQYLEHMPSVLQDEDACACAEDCVSNGFSVAPLCGCANHLGDGRSYCYVAHEDCPDAIHSSMFLGALYRECAPSPPHMPTSVPPLAPTSSPSSSSPSHILFSGMSLAIMIAIPVSILCVVLCTTVIRTRTASRDSSPVGARQPRGAQR